MEQSPVHPGRGARARRILDWWFRDRRTGRIVIAQFPNPALWIFLATVALRWVVGPGTTVGRPAGWVAVAALTWWAVDELVRGVNPWRRVLGAVVVVAVLAGCGGDDPAGGEAVGTATLVPVRAAEDTATTTSTTSTTTPPPTTTTLVPPDGRTAADRQLRLLGSIGGDIAPKSVVSSGAGLFFAQNMMYRHTVTVYDRSRNLVATIDDTVVPADFGHADFPGQYRGSPVEVAFTSDGSHAYVSNYRMYGGGLSTEASDNCNAGNWPDSFVYRVDAATLRIDQLLRVGSVPKFVAVTPDDRLVLVANWCGFDLSVLDVATGAEVTRVPLGRHPRGIVVAPDSSVAYVAVMGSRDVARVDLTTFDVDRITGVGTSPRHLVLSPDGATLYVSLNGEGRLAAVDLATGTVVATVATGAAPRSMAISDDGTALYVVNYNSNSLSKVRTADMAEIAEISTGAKPIGVTYDAATRQVWVANYSGTIQVFEDQAPG